MTNLAGQRSHRKAAESIKAHELRRSFNPLRVLIVAPSLEILGGQAVQASRILKKL